MKCIKHNLTGVVIRVTDDRANELVGEVFSYVSKSEYKKQSGGKTEEQLLEVEKKVTTSSKKVERHLKLKAKQR